MPKQENQYFISAWHKYGRISFEYIVLEYCEGEDVIKERELYWMQMYDCTNRDKGYNLRMDTSTNIIVNDETRKKLSTATLARMAKPEERLKQSKASTKMWAENPELKEQMRKAVKKAKQEKYKYLQYTRSMELIREWSTVEDIINENPDYKWQNIYSVCNGYKPTIYGYVWRKELKI